MRLLIYHIENSMHNALTRYCQDAGTDYKNYAP